ncbi:hypothetical protein GCM10025865_11380 [Paraoerskovia sediminicola]|uniref:Transcriptional regulator LacI/GalR-like sensor domain-containing protein n=1 Tax=Paraoerskovia sediminicola TaxID=1138587 RepID=A0ABM8G184_9CELL|nr:substrate-binding domain-containing protein [Paraoerskovia sediminicola]BDZ41839.1 hypothetical protein GCM10025865_11380 [Paraoerskovia sediminicola]
MDPRTRLLPDIASVSAANLSGARQVTEHLTALGHRQIGVIGGPEDWSASADRDAGHAAAAVAVGVMPTSELQRHVEPTVEDGRLAAGELLDLADRPTALVCFNDKIALGALRAAAERGLRVPDDLSVTGFDDSDVSRATTPRLTTVRQPLEEMGRIAVGLLLRLLDGRKVEELHVSLATRLVVGGSTAPAPRGPAR